MTVYQFQEQLEWSQSVDVSEEAVLKILKMVPASCDASWASPHEDRDGTDLWVHRIHDLPKLSVDFKHRSFCPIERFGTDDVCIETTSVYDGPRNGRWLDQHRRKPGWTVDETKRTDLIVYTWPWGDTRRIWIAYFPLLCAASLWRWREWSKEYPETPTLNRGYITLNCYVPRERVIEAMRRVSCGKVGR